MRTSLLFLPVLLFALIGCDRTPTAIAPTTSPAIPRIVSMVPAASLNLVLIGAADRLVGVSTYDSAFLPEPQKNLPIVGDYDNINLELLVKLHPSAVIVQFSPAHLSERLRDVTSSHHIELINMKLDTIEDLWPAVQELGRISGKEKEARAAIDTAKLDLQQIAADSASRPRVKVLYIVGSDPLTVAGGKTFIDQMLTLAGGQNLAASIGTLYPIISKETLAKLAPDVLLIGAPAEPDQQQNDPRLDPYISLPILAARNHRIFLITDDNPFLSNLHIAGQVRSLAALLHQNEPPQLDFSPAKKTATTNTGGGAQK